MPYIIGGCSHPHPMTPQPTPTQTPTMPRPNLQPTSHPYPPPQLQTMEPRDEHLHRSGTASPHMSSASSPQIGRSPYSQPLGYNSPATYAHSPSSEQGHYNPYDNSPPLAPLGFSSKVSTPEPGTNRDRGYDYHREISYSREIGDSRNLSGLAAQAGQLHASGR